MKRHQIITVPLLLATFFTFVSNPVLAKIYINEFSSSTTDDWIEFYNDGDNSVDLSQFRIRDNTQNNFIELAGTISPKSFASVDWYNKLNKDGDTIKLIYKADENLIEDQVGYGDNSPENTAPTGSQTLGRKPNGGGSWTLLTQPTKNGSNHASSEAPPPTPLPTATPTSAPTPTRTPTPTKTPTPTRTPTPAKSSPTIKSSSLQQPSTTSQKTLASNVLGSSTKKVSPTIKKEKRAIPTAILGAKDENSKPSNKVLVKEAKEERPSTPLLVQIMVAGGVISLTFCGILFYQNRKKGI